MRRLLRALFVATLVAGLAALGSPAASADDDGLIRVAHLSPDTPAVDVYVGPVGGPAAVVLRHLSYGTITGYRHVAPGSYTVAMRAAGAATTVPPVLATRVQVTSGAGRTVALAGPFATAALTVLADDLAPPAAGHARVRVINGAATAASLDVSLDGSAVARALPFAHTGGYVDVPAGAGTLEIAPGGAAGTSAPVALAAGSVYTVVVLDRARGGQDVRAVLDAAGPRAVPVGGVATGAGGTAGDDSRSPVPVAAALAALGLLAVPRSRRPVMVLVTAAAIAVAVPPQPPAPAVHPAAAVASATVSVLPTGFPSVLPTRVRIPALGIDSDLAHLGTDAAGALVPPADFARAGWFTGGPVPGAVGPAVIAGHVDSYRGPAVFFRLSRLHSGDAVLVTRADGTTLSFTVTRVARYAKTAFPTATVYGPPADPELRLITCGGRFDPSRRSYVDDVVVFARLA